MKKEFKKGVYPVMLTPYTKDNKVDYESLENLVEWYIHAGVTGLFAVCQSSEMFFLSLEERVNITKFIVEKAAGRVAVISSGHISDSIEEQAHELNKIAQTGVDAVILITNRLAKEEESDQIWLENLKKLMEKLPKDVPLGFYESPYPYKRLITPEILSWCAGTERFYFIKDTCCDLKKIGERLEAIKGTNIQLFNANASTLLESLKIGAAGFSGVMANFHPELYVSLIDMYKIDPEKAQQLSDLVTVASLIERQVYPINAKYYQKQIGNFKTIACRSQNPTLLNDTCILELEKFTRFVEFGKKAILGE